MNKSNPYECAQAALVFNHLLLRSPNIDPDALTHFCGDPESPLRKLVTELFTKEEPAVVAKKVDVPLFRPVATGDFPAIASFSSTAGFGRENVHGLKFILGPHFLANFFGMVEGNVPVCDVATAMLMKKATNVDIRKDLDGREEMFLAHFHHALVNHGTGSKWAGFLLGNGEQNIFFIRDKQGMLWSVYARLLEGGVWDIEAFPLADQAPWGPDSQVVFKR